MRATHETCVASADPAALETFHLTLERFWTAVDGAVPPPVRVALSTAIAEVAANIIRHAKADTLSMALTLDGERLEACFRDRGLPLRVAPRDVTTPESMAEGGRGLLLARQSLDALDYDRTADGVNCWRLAIVLPEVT